jgi:hypothetical protein
MFQNYISLQNISNLFEVEDFPEKQNFTMEPHGLGRYRTKEYAERVRAALIGLLQVYRNDEPHQDNEDHQWNRNHLCIDFERVGKRVIEQGCYD